MLYRLSYFRVRAFAQALHSHRDTMCPTHFTRLMRCESGAKVRKKITWQQTYRVIFFVTVPHNPAQSRTGEIYFLSGAMNIRLLSSSLNESFRSVTRFKTAGSSIVPELMRSSKLDLSLTAARLSMK